MLSLLLVSSTLLLSGEVEDAMRVLDHLQSAVTSVEYRETPLEALLSDLSVQSQITIQGDWDSLIRLGIDATDRISFTSDRTDVFSILKGLEVTLGDEFERPIFEVHAGLVMLTTIEATSSMRLLDVYDVRDLLVEHELIQELRDQRPPIMEPADLEAEEVDDDQTLDSVDGELIEKQLSPGEELLFLLIDHVDPEAWVEYGGDSARIDERDGVLFVSAAPRVHRHLREALRLLRRANPAQVEVQLQLVDLPLETHRLITQRHRKGSPMLLEALKRHGTTMSLWKNKVMIKQGETARLEATTKGSSILAKLSPSLDPESGLISLSLEFTSEKGETRRTVSTTLAFPQGRRSLFVEIPSVGEAESMMLLLVTLDPG